MSERPTGSDPGLEEAVRVLERIRVKRPPMFRVVLHNDDYTTQEFVVHVLVRFFQKDASEATMLMLRAHTSGTAVVGLYTRDVAETRIALAQEYAGSQGYPLLLTAEPDAPCPEGER